MMRGHSSKALVGWAPTFLSPATLLPALTVLGLLGCGGDSGTTGPTAGTVEVSLVTPNTDDAAMVFRITGPSIGTVAGVDGNDYLHVVGGGSNATVVLVGDLPEGGLVRFPVPDIGDAGAYQATILEVADDANDLRESLVGYQLSVRPLGT